MKVAIDLQLFSKMAENGEEPKSTVDLAIATKSDPVLLTRLLKHMAATEVVRETSANHFILTPLSKALIEPKYSDPFPLLSVQPPKAVTSRT
ncbi:catechol o-methyltransferase [Phlyctema vagabunda]|uniref:Catechol o-methyltransferase n=1 Tax=Phlyctema vagabunda TaxID=108571 RepID=A0ABR4PSH3_9HELO